MRNCAHRSTAAAAILCVAAAIGGCQKTLVLDLHTQDEMGDLIPAGPRTLLGVNAGPYHTSLGSGSLGTGDVQYAGEEYMDLGVTSVRTHDNDNTLDINDIYPHPAFDLNPTIDSDYNWTASEEQFKAAVAAGKTVYLRIGGSAADGTGFLPSAASGQAWENFKAVSLHIAEHFIDGFKTSADGEDYSGPILGVEIWNEPNNTAFWSLGPGAFHEYFIFMLASLKAKYGDALKVGGPGFGWEVFHTDPSPFDELAAALVKAAGEPGGENVRPDFISWHTYTPDAGTFAAGAALAHGRIETLRLDLNKVLSKGIQTIESHVTEWNNGDKIEESRVTGEGCAQLTAVWIEMQRLGINQAFVHRGWDNHDPDVPGEPYGFGLLAYDSTIAPPGTQTRKAIAESFDLWSDYCEELGEFLHVVRAGDENTDVHVLVQKTSKGHLLLLANVGSGNAHYRVELPGGDEYVSGGDMEITELDDKDGSPKERSGSGTRIKLKGHSVQLVRIP